MRIDWITLTGTALITTGAGLLGLAYGHLTGFGVFCLYVGQRFWQWSGK
jgi:hypothetical protein